MNAFKYIRRSIAVSLLMFAPAMEAVSRASTVVVTPSNPDGWTLTTVDDTYTVNPAAGTAAFVNGPGTPPLGTGSVNLATASGGGDGSAMIGTSALDGLPLSAITSLSYSTYVTQNNGQQFPYIALSFASTGSGPADDNVIFEPPYQNPVDGNPGLTNQGTTALTTWQNWNAIVGGWWDGNGVAGTPGSGVVSFGTVLADYPNAVIADFASPYNAFLGLEFQVGEGGPTDNFNGNVDDITIGINGANTTYDLEVPEPASAGLLLVGGATALMRRRRRAAK
jgi:hypothetical protein